MYKRQGQQGSTDRAVYAAGQRQQNSAVAYFFPDLCNGSLGVVAHSPVTGAAADLFQETVQHGQTILGVVYLRVELYGIQFLLDGYKRQRLNRSISR